MIIAVVMTDVEMAVGCAAAVAIGVARGNAIAEAPGSPVNCPVLIAPALMCTNIERVSAAVAKPMISSTAVLTKGYR